MATALAMAVTLGSLTVAMATGVVPRGHVVDRAAADGNWEAIQASCGTDNPYFVTVRHDFGRADRNDNPALLAFRDTPTDTFASNAWRVGRYLPLATQGEVGTAWGLDVDPAKGAVYVGAYFKVDGLASPTDGSGLEAIHRVDLRTGDVSLLAELGATARTGHSRSSMGKIGLGDLELNDDGSLLFAVHLGERSIYRVATVDGAVLGSFPHGAAGEAWADNARPFGLGYHDGWLYHGVVDSRERTSTPGRFAASIYRSRDDGSEMAEVARFDLDYPRPQQVANLPADMVWRTWSDDLSYGSGLQPVLTDIEFRPNGDLILGLGDRTQLVDFDTENGDVLPSAPDGPGRWRILTTTEHYADRYVEPALPRYPVEEPLQGQLAAVPGRDSVVSLGLLSTVHSGGGWWFHNATGQVAGPADGREHLFGEEMYAGDVEALCGPTTTRRFVAYLPMAARRDCLRTVHIDAMLVIDVSTSMDDPVDGGRIKQEAAIDAAMSFAFLLDLDSGAAAPGPVGDRIAVAGFNDHAWLESGLTSNEAKVLAALSRLPELKAEGTRLDLALLEALDVLQSTADRGARRPVVILLTDGMPNRVPVAEDGRQETTVLRAASRLKATGAQVYTIGIGNPAAFDADLLRGIASLPERYAHAPTGTALRQIFAELAAGSRCR